jgi:hypothetical protein
MLGQDIVQGRPREAANVRFGSKRTFAAQKAQKRTCAVQTGMSAKGQRRTSPLLELRRV